MSGNRGALMPVNVGQSRALIPVMSVNDRRGALMPVMSLTWFQHGSSRKADVVRAQDAAKAIRLNSWYGLRNILEKARPDAPRNGDPYR